MEQYYEIKQDDSFNLKHIFECGQCFRWNKEEDGSYTGVFKNSVLNVKAENGNIIFKGICNGNIKDIVIDYFDLDTDYGKIKEELKKVDKYLEESINFGSGIRILNQDLWEMLISFIISANNNIPRIYETTQKIKNNEFKLEQIKEIKDTNLIREKLKTLPGVGPKVADCILLFGLKRFEVFPIDVWVRRVMNDLYIKKEDETKVNKKEIEELAKTKYKNLAGISQQ